MGINISDIIAVYAGIISTGVAIHQFKLAKSATNFLCIDHTLFHAEANSHFEFYISNRGAQPTTITDLLIAEHTFHWFGLKKEFDGGHWDNRDKKNPNLPICLKPGETITLFVYHEKAVKAAFPPMNIIKGKRKKIRFLHVKHSQSENEYEYAFKINDN